MVLDPGLRLGPYEIVAPLGAGGMGEVYRARDTRLGRDVALKVLTPSLSGDPDRLRRFEQEARAAGQLNHPNILVLHDIGSHEGSPYLVSELLEGETLRERLGSGPLPTHKAIDYALQIARGLAAAHAKGIVHRDLKPENVFVTNEGHLKILDFGLAKLMPERGGDTQSPTLTQNTDPGVVMGSVGYMSPEQVRGQVADHRSDIFSFGAMLFEMASGERAFKRDTAAETMTAILKEEPRAPRMPLAAELERLVRHCLEKKPEERFQSVRDISFNLEALSGISTATAAIKGLSFDFPMMSTTNLNRHLAAVLFADAVGFSRLMQTDEEATVRCLRASREIFRRVVEEHDGRIIDTAGDSILAEFESVLQAVQSAIAVQTALGNESGDTEDRMAFRIGVNLGDILRSDDGTIYGDAVNVAARVQALATAGGICVSGIVREQVARKAALTFEDLGQQAVKNIDEPIHVYRVRMPNEATPRIEPAPVAPGKPADASIAVLPFSNMSGHQDQEYFSDGITEDIITDLSKIAELFVIARNSSFVYKGKSVSVPEVARDLGVRYVLEGSVRRAGDRVRVTAQLIDGTNGGHVWGERYDRQLDDIFAVQDDLTRSIVETLKVKLSADELRRVTNIGTSNVQAYDLFLRGKAAYLMFTPDGIRRARELYQRAHEADASYADPHDAIARTYVYEWATGLSLDRTQSLDIAVIEAERAVALNPELPIAQATLGWASLWAGDHARALAAGERSVLLAPNDADVLVWHALCLSFCGRADDAENLVEAAFRLNPHTPAHYYYARGQDYFLMETFDRAIEVLRLGIIKFPTFVPSYLYLAASYALSDRLDEAAKVKADIVRLSPGYTLAGAASRAPWKYPVDEERLLHALKLAGFDATP
jgi:adenylate cyclase